MDELEFYKSKAARFEKALRQIVDTKWRCYDGMLSAARWALSEQERIEMERATASQVYPSQS
jgi:hypothetical protein